MWDVLEGAMGSMSFTSHAMKLLRFFRTFGGHCHLSCGMRLVLRLVTTPKGQKKVRRDCRASILRLSGFFFLPWTYWAAGKRLHYHLPDPCIIGYTCFCASNVERRTARASWKVPPNVRRHLIKRQGCLKPQKCFNIPKIIQRYCAANKGLPKNQLGMKSTSMPRKTYFKVPQSLAHKGSYGMLLNFSQ